MDLVSRHFCFIAHRKSSLYSLGLSDDGYWNWLEHLTRTNFMPKDLSRLEGVTALKIPGAEPFGRYSLRATDDPQKTWKRLTPDFLK